MTLDRISYLYENPAYKKDFCCWGLGVGWGRTKGGGIGRRRAHESASISCSISLLKSLFRRCKSSKFSRLRRAFFEAHSIIDVCSRDVIDASL